MSIPQPCRPSCTVAYFVSQADPDTVSASRAVLHKTADAQTITVSTAAGDEQIVTDVAGGIGRFSQLTIRGDELDALLVQTEAKTAVLVVDADQLVVEMKAPVELSGNLNIDGRLIATAGTYLSSNNPLMYIATNQANDTVNQGWYAEYSPDGIAVNYRGILYHPQSSQFIHFDQLATEPTTLSTITANARMIVDNAESVGNIVRFDSGADSISMQFALPVGADYIYAVPDASQNAEFLLTEGAQTITGLQTFATLEATGPIYGTAYDSQMFSFRAYLNPSNPNLAIGPLNNGAICNYWSGGSGNIVVFVTFGNFISDDTIEFGNIQVRLRQGNYVLEFGYRRQSNQGIGEIYCTALGVTLTFDQYNATTVGATQRISFAVPAAGIYEFALRRKGKNASSTGYFLDFWSYMAFQQTA